MSLRETLSRALGCYRTNFGKLFLPVLIMQMCVLLPLLLFTMPGTVNGLRALVTTINAYSRAGAGQQSVFYGFALIIGLLLFVSPAMVSAAVYVVERDGEGRLVTLRDEWYFARSSYWRMFRSYMAAIALAVPLTILSVLILLPLVTAPSPEGHPYPQYIWRGIVVGLLFLLYLLGITFLPYVVVTEGRGGFAAVFRSFRCVYGADFVGTLGKLAAGGLIVAALMVFINWLAQLPFAELFDLYLRDPAAALREPLMGFAITLSILAIFVVSLVIPFWYAVSYNTYLDARQVLDARTRKRVLR